MYANKDANFIFLAEPNLARSGPDVLGEATVSGCFSSGAPARQRNFAALLAAASISFCAGLSMATSTDGDSSGGRTEQGSSERGSPEQGSPEQGSPEQEPGSFTLPNGLRVILLPDRDAPVLSVCSAFDAGARRDSSHRPGVARTIAELLRNGGRPLEGQDVGALLARRGGTAEVNLSHDALTSCVTVPSSELEFALWFEAGRFGRHALTAEGRDRVVAELSAEFERRDDLASDRAPRRLRALAFQGRPSYARDVLASSAQLAEVELSDLERFHRAHFGAEQAVVAVVGDFDEASARRLVEQQLGSAPRGSAATSVDFELPLQTSERFSMVEDPSARVPAVWYGWVLPRAGTEARTALELVAVALASESRLGSSIVGQRRPAQSLDYSLTNEVGAGFFSLHAVGTGAAALGAIEKAVDAELAKVGQYGLRPEEVRAARSSLAQRRALELASNLGRARALSRGVLFGGTPEGILSEPESTELLELSNVSLARAAREHLHSRRRTVIEIYPKGWQDPWQTPMPVYHLVSAGENLGRIAAMHQTTVAVIAKMNGLDPKKPIYPGQNLKVPRSKATTVKAVVHTVRSGDTLTAIAKKFNVSVQSLADANGLDPKRPIRPGDELRVPPRGSSRKSGGSGSARPSERRQGAGQQGAGQQGASQQRARGRVHEVKAGETLGGIALKYGVSTASLASANGLGRSTTIRVGQKLQIPSPAGGPASKGATQSPPTVHQVRSGETLSGIAKRYRVSVQSLTRANGISEKRPIRVGQRLVIPR